LVFGLNAGFADAAVLAEDEDEDEDEDVDEAEASGATADAAGNAVVAAVEAGAIVTAGLAVVGCGFGPKPKSCGARHKTIPSPMMLTSRSMTEKTKSFCRVDGPRERTTTVGVRGRLGRSGMRIVSAT
jgi:hypothetical protein